MSPTPFVPAGMTAPSQSARSGGLTRSRDLVARRRRTRAGVRSRRQLECGGHRLFAVLHRDGRGVYDAFHHGKDAAVVAGTRMQLVVGDAFYTGVCRVDIDQR
jgi:hypothetical protein